MSMTDEQKIVLTAGIVITALGAVTTAQMFIGHSWPSFGPFVLTGIGVVITLAGALVRRHTLFVVVVLLVAGAGLAAACCGICP